MRICLLSRAYPPDSRAPAAASCAALAEAMAARGHDVHVLTTGGRGLRRHERGVWVHEVPVAIASPPLHSQPEANELLSAAEQLYEALVRLSAEAPFDLVDAPLAGAPALVAAHRYAEPVVLRVAGPPASAGAVAGLERACLQRAAGLRGASERAIEAALEHHRVQLAAPRLVVAPEDEPAADRALAFYGGLVAAARGRPAPPPAIYQVMEALDVGDAVSNITRRNAAILAELGQPREVLARFWHPELAAEVRPLHHALARPSGLIFHYWGHNSSTWLLRAVRGPKAVHYHNITPPEFFAHDPALQEQMRRGYEQLAQIADQFDLAIGDSWYNIGELAAHMTRAVPTLAVYPVIEPEEIRRAPCDEALLAALRASGEVNLVFVGRIARNKRQDRLIQLFDHYYRTVNRHARLWLVGSGSGDPAYSAELEELRLALPSGGRVSLTGKVSDAELGAYCRAADVFVCASEHEGFCMPIAQAMALDVPVVAYAAAAVPETMGGSGLLVDSWDVPRVAELLQLLVSDQPLREQIVAGQRRALGRFSAAEARRRLGAIVEFLRTGALREDVGFRRAARGELASSG